MFWTIAGLVIAAGASLATLSENEKSRVRKLLLIGLAIAGLVVGTVSAVSENKEKNEATSREQQIASDLKDAKAQLKTQDDLLSIVNATVGDLGILNRLSGKAKYYVRISADTSPARLQPYLAKVDAQFKGAQSSGLVLIRPPKPGSQNYELVFGSGLDVAAAAVFKELADSHHFPPAGQFAVIEPEP